MVVLLRNITREGSAGEGERHDAYKHDENADDLLDESARAEVTVADCRDGGDREVECGQILVALIHLGYVARHPRVRIALVELSGNDPDATENVRSKCKVENEQDDSLEGLIESRLLMRVTLNRLRALFL